LANQPSVVDVPIFPLMFRARQHFENQQETSQTILCDLLRQQNAHWPEGYAEAVSPFPFLIDPQHHQELQQIHHVLAKALRALVLAWCRDEDGVRSQISLHPQAEALLLEHFRHHDPSIEPHLGAFR
jgi:hypothetical protein